MPAQVEKTTTLIFTGKGGVGKTTVAAATAVKLADQGQRTLIISTDPAHSLGDCLQAPLGPDPAEISPRLDAMELDTRKEMLRRFASIREVLMKQMAKQGVTNAIGEELVNFPGSDELFGLLKLADLKKSGRYDAIVMDTAPTGNTLRFLHFPEFLAPVRRALSIDRTYTRTMRPLLTLLGRDVPKDDFFTSTFSLLKTIEDARTEFLGEDTYFRLVLVPEKLAVVETQRAVSFLNVSGYTVDSVIANKVLPADMTEPLFRNWVGLHQAYLAETRRSFYPLRISELPLYDSEVLGLPLLRKVADALYEEIDPLRRMTDDDLFRLDTEDGGVVMRVQLPVPEGASLDLYKEGNLLTIELDGYERRLHCPEMLADQEVLGAQMAGNVLSIRFGSRPPQGETRSGAPE
ncbi:ArsA family ATPase [Amycolatopsis lurida]